MNDDHFSIISDSIAAARQRCDNQILGERLFAHFFTRFPETRDFFTHTPIPSFGPKKIRNVENMLLNALRSHAYAVDAMLSEMFRHDCYGVQDKTYFYGMLDAYRDAIREALGDDWTPTLEQYWDEALQAAKAALQQAHDTF